MPTSNGQVTSRDLRQGLLKSNHFPSDALIETDFIQDQAVTIDKNSNPVGYAYDIDHLGNPTITTTPTVFPAVSLDIPAWAEFAVILGIYYVQVSAGNTQNLSIDLILDFGAAAAARVAGITESITSGKISFLQDVDVYASTVPPGSTIELVGQAYTSSASETANQQRLEVAAFFGRSAT